MVSGHAQTSDGYGEHFAEVRRVTLVGLLVNLLLSAVKFIAGTVGHSQVIVADAVHSLSDSTTDVAILVGMRYWSQPPDAEHPHGHRRIETVVTTIIGLFLMVVGAVLAYKSLTSLKAEHTYRPGWIAFAAAVVSIVVKEALYHWSAAVGKRAKSSAVVANAWHHRTDSLSSIPAAIAVAVAAVKPTWVFVDHLGALVVSFFVLQVAWRIVAKAAAELVDVGAPREACDRIEAIAKTTPGVQVIHAVRTRFIGSGLQVDLHIQVDGQMSVRDGHEISGAVKRRLIESGPDVIDVVVHLEPVKKIESDRQA